MKQLCSISEISLVVKDPYRKGFSICNFHLDLLVVLIKELACPVSIFVSDKTFDSVIKYLNIYLERGDSVFISGDGGSRTSPAGFSTTASRHLKRAKELLADGLDNISLLIISSSGESLPVIGLGVGRQLNVSGTCSFEECCAFLKQENYILSDFVTSPGEYSIRGGIIDVFLYSRDLPCRISFLEDAPLINSFSVDTQLTGGLVYNLEMVSVLKRRAKAIGEVDMSSFLNLRITDAGVLKNNTTNDSSPNYNLKTINYRGFYSLRDSFVEIKTSRHLASIGLANNNKVVVPEWFIKKRRYKEVVKKSVVSLSLSDIGRGDFLVHRDHGVCVFLGLVQKSFGKIEQEFISLRFFDEAVILVDVARVDLITFFAPFETEGVRLDSLSKKNAWIRKRSSAKARAEETISSLLNLYVKRRGIKRNSYIEDADLEKDFISSFPYKDTADQLSAWKEISSDLRAPHPMDRLLCGDVGFGKTELAIRAAFRVVLSGKRVVVLSPTTILTNQLYHSFLNRVGDYGASVEMISRFRSKKDVNTIQTLITRGLNDVLIGTHAILNNDIYLKNIGLVIIDEEHRFGVRHKEKIKRFKGGVDVLSMSATPIPRSMNMAISKIYSISTLQTPPKLRLPIKTRVEYYSLDVLREAILFEINRGGQVYFVHNDIGSIKSLTGMVASWFPNNTIEFLHGQEAGGAIEKKMVSFVNGKIDVLICTTIIESGIDVSNANCIIINNSHLFGLSQLYQMRGRVGRGQQQAYAYLLVPRGLSLSEKSFKRIKSIEENTSLGSGYNVSVADMEIRGGGSLFGYKQSGGSSSLGYEMYAKMVQRSLHDSGRLETSFKLLPEDVVVNIYKARLIPENYISIENIRMSIYKNIAISTNSGELNNIRLNLKDRFGPPPIEVLNLIKEQGLKLLASSVGINSIKIAGCGLIISIHEGGDLEYIKTLIDFIIVFFNKQKFIYHILPSKGLFFSVCIHLDKGEDIYTFFSSFLGKFSASN